MLDREAYIYLLTLTYSALALRVVTLKHKKETK